MPDAKRRSSVSPMSGDVPTAIAEATVEQPAARAALRAALRTGPSHAYSFIGPSGSGKSAAARALAAELLATGADDPDDVRRRVLADPSPHPDLAWLRPPGNQHLVEDIRREVIGAVSYRPFEGLLRVFVIEQAEAMAEESQNALLKTLEEPPPYAHLILITTEPSGLLETVRSRCQRISFAPLAPEALQRRLAAELPGAGPEQLAALTALAGGDLDRGRLLGSPWGSRVRDIAERCSSSAAPGESRTGGLAARPWAELLSVAAERGKDLSQLVVEAAGDRAAEIGEGKDANRIKREGADAAKRADRHARTEAIDLALGLVAGWFTDLVAVAEGAPGAVRNVDRMEALQADARGIDPRAARRVAELAMETRRRLNVNVNEDLALDALFHRASSLLGESADVL